MFTNFLWESKPPFYYGDGQVDFTPAKALEKTGVKIVQLYAGLLWHIVELSVHEFNHLLLHIGGSDALRSSGDELLPAQSFIGL